MGRRWILQACGARWCSSISGRPGAARASAEVPTVVAAYQKLHDKGFEIVGISLDHDLNSLLNYTAANGMTWPQYFDGKGWQNSIGHRIRHPCDPCNVAGEQERLRRYHRRTQRPGRPGGKATGRVTGIAAAGLAGRGRFAGSLKCAPCRESPRWGQAASGEGVGWTRGGGWKSAGWARTRRGSDFPFPEGQ